ncbi:LysR substrate-binding domain-containing protein [Nocardia tengchongensis]|uniref:LysR substrate-binding domain-containing protein n=1 Tax=Nocardia tengchongensis TaxID=2055889 RepID=UPI0036A308F5
MPRPTGWGRSSSRRRCRSDSGAAPAVVSRLIVAHELRAGTLRAVPLAESTPLTRKFRAIWHRRTPPTGPAAELVELAARIEAARTQRH